MSLQTAVLQGTEQLIATFSGDVDATQFIGDEFSTFPSVVISDNIAQASPTSLEVTFLDDISLETNVELTGSPPGVASPTSVPIT